MIGVLVIALSQVSGLEGSGAAGGVEGSVGWSADAERGPNAPSAIGDTGQEVGLTAAPENCPSARKGLRWYRGRYAGWRERTGVRSTPQGAGEAKPGNPLDAGLSCPRIRYLAERWRAKAYAARLAFELWYAYHYDWRSWLPGRWQRIGACETGYGRRPGDWRWNSDHDEDGRVEGYQGAFGFHYGTWDLYRKRAARKAGPYPDEAYEATPRQQYEVALAVWRAVGYGAWGCG